MIKPLKRRHKRRSWSVIEVHLPDVDNVWVAPPQHRFPFVHSVEDAWAFHDRHTANAHAGLHLSGHNWHTVRMAWSVDRAKWVEE